MVNIYIIDGDKILSSATSGIYKKESWGTPMNNEELDPKWKDDVDQAKRPVDAAERTEWLAAGAFGKLLNNSDETIQSGVAMMLMTNSAIVRQLTKDQERKYYTLVALAFNDFDLYFRDVDLHEINEQIKNGDL